MTRVSDDCRKRCARKIRPARRFCAAPASFLLVLVAMSILDAPLAQAAKTTVAPVTIGVQVAQGADCVRTGARDSSGRAIYRCEYGDESYTGPMGPAGRGRGPGGGAGGYEGGPSGGRSDPSGMCSSAAMTGRASSNVINVCRSLGWVF